MLQTDGKGSLVSGAARVASTGAIGVSAILSVFDTSGKCVAETGIGNSEPMSSFVLPVDTTGYFNTGLALFNFTWEGVTVTMSLRDTSGQQVGRPLALTLAALNHIARFIYGPGQLFPEFANFQGSLLIESSAPIASAVLRQCAAAALLLLLLAFAVFRPSPQEPSTDVISDDKALQDVFAVASRIEPAGLKPVKSLFEVQK
jgi:hypothetical protein